MRPGATVIALRNHLGELERLNAELAAFGRAHALAPRPLAEMNLALEELVTNIISYAYEDGHEHVIRIELWSDREALIARVEDDGRAFDATSIKEPDLKVPLEERRVGGLGMHLVRTLMDHVEYTRVRDRNIVLVTKRTSGGAAAASANTREG